MAQQSQELIKELKKTGERITPIRRALLENFCNHPKPQTPQELLSYLEKKGLMANKTTVYRQLEILVQLGLIKEINFSDRSKRYEMASKEHHHHLICQNCKKVEDINLDNDLDKQEKKIWQKHHFKVLQHSLEFFGLCSKCQ
ncbi:MAG: transcriptional repressor [Candidatus Magasanikbacteria bacterium]|nr:transcriptional repressor [Candidatus Magasanikbacteria bacterium]